MKKFILISFILSCFFIAPAAHAAYNFGDYKSSTLATKAWDALAAGDTDAVLAYTNKAIEFYAAKAKEMQKSLTGYVEGASDEKFKLWALNDVATSYFIQGQAYEKAGMNERAKLAYQTVIDEYSYGQAWDPKGWFWKPAESAKKKLELMATPDAVDFGDNSSSFLTGQAWKAIGANQYDKAIMYADKAIELYADKAKEMQASLTEYPWGEKEEVFKFWALNDVGTAFFIKGQAYSKSEKKDEAKKAYEELVNNYRFSQCWDPQGWFWKPAEAAQTEIDQMSVATAIPAAMKRVGAN